VSSTLKKVAVAAGLVFIAGLTSSVDLEAAESYWTYDYDCDYYILLGEHQLNAGGADLGSNPHERIPGGCGVHPTYQ
jgi:hypothetical protein